jgi:hAT family C-terminal dimerisation region
MMVMDYLPVQASAVPCERIFSSSAETDTKRRNRISPPLMEALQMLKFHLKKERLNFTAAWMTKETDMVDDTPDDDLLDHLLDGDFQDGLDRIIQSINDDET